MTVLIGSLLMTMQIGEFARRAQISVRMLRYYDEQEIFKPAYTDSQTGYRYYIIHQIAEIRRILSYVQMGLSLAEIRQIRDSDYDEAFVYHLLNEKHHAIQKQLTQQQQRLQQLRYHIETLEHCSKLPQFSVVIDSMPAQHSIVGRRLLEHPSQVRQFIYQSLECLQPLGLPLTGIEAIYHNDISPQTSQVNNTIDLTCAFHISCEQIAGLPDDDMLKLHEQTLPAINRAAIITLNDAFKRKYEVIAFFHDWAAYHGYQLCGAPREQFLRVNERNPDHPDNLMDMIFPIRPMS